jgi:hypothetical protein
VALSPAAPATAHKAVVRCAGRASPSEPIVVFKLIVPLAALTFAACLAAGLHAWMIGL